MNKIKESLQKAGSVASLYSVPASAAIVGWLASFLARRYLD